MYGFGGSNQENMKPGLRMDCESFLVRTQSKEKYLHILSIWMRRLSTIAEEKIICSSFVRFL